MEYFVQFFATFWQVMKIGQKELISMYKDSFLETNIEGVVWFVAVWTVLYCAMEIISDISEKEKKKYKVIDNKLSYLSIHTDNHIDNINLCKVNIQQLFLDMDKMKKKIVRLEKEVRKYD